ncbi:YdcF family protein [Paenibacillus thailandensis]|uniref:YdcF family protein n=1 Tax=Paenibacillus thailandensis TaxID=393250 RepID=A0ABW5QU98_9BACL
MKPNNRRGSSSRKRKSARPWLLLFRLMSWCIVAGVFWCGYLLYLINGYDYSRDAPKADAAIVLGAALWNDMPSPALKERLDSAYGLYKEGKVGKLILTGGLDGNGSKLTEAEGMRNYLVALGVPEDKLLLELKARSTYENLLFSKPIAEAYDLDRLLIVTHDYHASRADEIAGFLDYSNYTMAAFPSEVLNPVKNESREVLAYTKWKLDELLLSLGAG